MSVHNLSDPNLDTIDFLKTLEAQAKELGSYGAIVILLDPSGHEVTCLESHDFSQLYYCGALEAAKARKAEEEWEWVD